MFALIKEICDSFDKAWRKFSVPLIFFALDYWDLIISSMPTLLIIMSPFG